MKSNSFQCNYKCNMILKAQNYAASKNACKSRFKKIIQIFHGANINQGITLSVLKTKFANHYIKCSPCCFIQSDICNNITIHFQNLLTYIYLFKKI